LNRQAPDLPIQTLHAGKKEKSPMKFSDELEVEGLGIDSVLDSAEIAVQENTLGSHSTIMNLAGTEEDQIFWRAALKLFGKCSSPNMHLATARRCLGVYLAIGSAVQ
jgi:hypothetical protein